MSPLLLLLVLRAALAVLLLASLGCLGYGTWRLVDELDFRLASVEVQGAQVEVQGGVETRPSPGASEHWRKDEPVSVRHPVVRFRSPVDGRLHRFVSRLDAPGDRQAGTAIAVRASTRHPEEAREPRPLRAFVLPAALLLAGLLGTLLVAAAWRMPPGVPRALAGEVSLLRAMGPAALLAIVALLPAALRLADPYVSPVVPGILLLDAGQLARAMRAEPPPAGGPLLSRAEVRIARIPLLGRKAATRAVLDALQERRHEDLRRYLAAERDPTLRFPAELDRVAPFTAAIAAGDAAAVGILLDAGRDPRREPFLLSSAVLARQAELVRRLAAHGVAPADPAEARELAGVALAGDDDATLLALVQLGWTDRAPYGSTERSLVDRAVVRGLVRTSAELARRGLASTSPLLARVVQGDLAGMRAAAPEGEWLATRIDGAPLLAFAALAGQLPVVRRLVELGADPATAVALDGEPERSALDLAAQRGHLEVVRYLAGLPGARSYLEPGEPRDAPVSLAAAAGRWDVVEALVEAGASPNGRMRVGVDGGQTPLHFAARQGNARAVAYLLAHGADPLAEGGGALLAVELAEDPAVREAIERGGGRGP